MTLLRFLAILFFLGLQSCASQKALEEKINGVSFVASRDVIDESHVKPVVEIHANYAAIMPFGFIRDLSNPQINFNTERQWFGETRAGAKQYIEELRKHKIKTMMKPQIWIGRGEFTGYIKMNSEEEWKTFEESYSDFILSYAKQAEDSKCEILCIGTELENFIKERPQYWDNLIVKIKEIYSGKLTYAANWDEFKRTPFWAELDYIGIDAYFPTSDSKTPTVEECLKGWQTHKKEIESIQSKFDRPVLFTEFGYRSVDFSAKEPWRSDRDLTEVNHDAQCNSLKALFETFWAEDWFAGGFIWKWFHKHDEVGGMDNNQFTPQNKPVEKILSEYYSKF